MEVIIFLILVVAAILIFWRKLITISHEVIPNKKNTILVSASTYQIGLTKKTLSYIKYTAWDKDIKNKYMYLKLYNKTTSCVFKIVEIKHRKETSELILEIYQK